MRNVLTGGFMAILGLCSKFSSKKRLRFISLQWIYLDEPSLRKACYSFFVILFFAFLPRSLLLFFQQLPKYYEHPDNITTLTHKKSPHLCILSSKRRQIPDSLYS